MGGIAVVACGVCGAGGILIKDRTGAIPSFFCGWDVAGVFQAVPVYPLGRLVSAFRVVQNLPCNVSSKTA